MDFGGGQKPSTRSRLVFKNAIDENDPAETTTTSKRQRSNDDYQDHLLQQPPQTRRMIGMGLEGFPGSSGERTSSPLYSSTCRGDLAARRVQGLVSSPPKLTIGCEASISSSISDTSSSSPKGSGSTLCCVMQVAESEGIENESHDDQVAAGKIDGSFFSSGVFPSESNSTSKNSNSTSKDSNSNSKSPEAVGDRGGSRRCTSSSSSSDDHDRAYSVDKEGDVDEFELGHRLSYLQMRGYDQALLDVMDEGILEESSDEYSSSSELGHAEQQVLESHQQQYYEVAEVEVSFVPRDQPAVVTPERP